MLFPESSSTIAPPPLPPLRNISKAFPENTLSPLHIENPIENSVRNGKKARNTFSSNLLARPQSLMASDNDVFGETDLNGINHIRHRGLTQFPLIPDREHHSVSDTDG